MIKSDIELWKAFKKGDTPAFHQIYKKYYSSLYYFALKVTQDHAVSIDCLQNLFINLWNSRSNLSDVHAIKPYLFKALHRDLNKINNILVKRKSYGVELLELQVAPIFSPEDIIVEDETKQYLRTQVAEVLNALPIRQREAVYLKYYEDLSCKDIASIMGINYQSVVNLLFKAMVTLKKEENLQRLITLISCLPIMYGIGCFFLC